MKAYYATKYGGPEVMAFGEIPDPVAGKGQVVVRLRASSVNPVDWKVRGGKARLISGSKFPKAFGCDLAGVVESVGPGASQFSPGDSVVGYAPVMFGHPGAHAEKIAIAEKRIHRIPKGATFEEMGAMPVAALTALNGLRQCGDLRGREVLVNGATGGVGHFAVQIAKARGARVTAVSSAKNADRARELGADEVLDYKATDFTKGAKRYHVVFDAFGQVGLGASAPAIEKGGYYVTTLGSAGFVVQAIWSRLTGGPRGVMANMRDKAEDYAEMERLITVGHVKAIVGMSVPLEKAAEAYAAGERGGTVGKIVLTM